MDPDADPEAKKHGDTTDPDLEHWYISSKIKVIKKSQKSRNKGFHNYFLFDDGSKVSVCVTNVSLFAL